ncbi:hypothetical protein J1N35_026076 [Gossypium stocksii]|uniref:Uncharacterized protein n=1 Tax=Gossypium stocksii TaxID=47602 RepID=A0A9D3V8V9_9ROSI|nr:hypothetical protein J1N35_026076 [Gossypium stocksii]
MQVFYLLRTRFSYKYEQGQVRLFKSGSNGNNYWGFKAVVKLSPNSEESPMGSQSLRSASPPRICEHLALVGFESMPYMTLVGKNTTTWLGAPKLHKLVERSLERGDKIWG